MRYLLPMKELLNEVIGNMKLNHNQKTTVCLTVFEENNVALKLALNPRFTPRHIATKYHLFRIKVGAGTNIHIKEVDSQDKSHTYSLKVSKETNLQV